jgi:hypothetical protein
VSYTTIQNVAGMFPTWTRGNTQQKPSDSLVQSFIDDCCGDLDAILNKRFGEVIQSSYAGSFSAFQAAFSTDALNILERINRYGAAAQLAKTLATMGVTAAANSAKDFDSQYSKLVSDLRAVDENGRPTASGLYDYLFDPEARIESPRPGLQGIAGGDMPRGETARDQGLSDYFSKFDRDES